ncbi:ATP-dependent Clp protease proteolytic subunit [Streptomyces sp. NPDC058877]|uniref:ATP-dependent Clp protease proteolytic subunit n=1 Tax=unclassified Streptomyces TaxID=2593676 RepID=UPI003676073E
MDGRYVLPEFTEHGSFGVRTLDPYAKLLDSRIVLLGTPIDDTSAHDVIAQLLHLDHAAPGRDIALYINSPGGSVSAMTAIHDTLQALSCDVETTCLGRAGTTAAVLLAAGTPGKRLVLPGARVTLCQPTSDGPLQGRPDELEVHAHELLRQRALLAGLLAEHTGQEREQIDAGLDRLTVLDATAAVAFGLADHMVSSRRGTDATR